MNALIAKIEEHSRRWPKAIWTLFNHLLPGFQAEWYKPRYSEREAKALDDLNEKWSAGKWHG